MKQRIGIYSGTFDPIHKGHIAFALEVAKKCNLDKVVFLPEHSPRGKKDVTRLIERVYQLEDALRPHDNLEILVLNTRRFTYKAAMPEIRTALGDDADLTLLMGSDVAKGLMNGWEDAEKLFAECNVAIGLRGNDTEEDMSNLLLAVPAVRSCVFAVDYPHESSSRIRV